MNAFELFLKMMGSKGLTTTITEEPIVVEKEDPVYSHEELLYISAWGKIQKYIKENYAGVFKDDLEINVPIRGDTHSEIVIMPDGNSYIHRVEYEYDSDDRFEDYFFHPEKENSDTKNAITCIKSIVIVWEVMKLKIEEERIRINDLVNFKA